MISMSAPYQSPLTTLVILTPGVKITAFFHDDQTTRDISEHIPTMLLHYLLDTAQNKAEVESATDQVKIADIKISSNNWDDCRLALVDAPTHRVEEIPVESVPSLITSALAATVAAAVAAENEPEDSASYKTAGLYLTDPSEPDPTSVPHNNENSSEK